MKLVVIAFTLVATQAFAQMDHSHHGMAVNGEVQPSSQNAMSHHPMGPVSCGENDVWDNNSGMCTPLARPNQPMSMLMLHGNLFLTQIFMEGSRGENEFAVPNMLMADIGTTVGSNHYVNLQWMGTLEKWTFPKRGYPEFVQIGEEDENGHPFIDAQHPHSSPIMGLTLSDTITLGDGKDHLRLWVAPRGQSTDGPVAFMHRPSGMVNPDTPLGHHIGQDAGHITSSVIGAGLRLSNTQIEVSTFNGKEPEPTKVDLPVDTPNSYAIRLTQFWKPTFYTMASAAYVKEPGHAGIDHIWRYSASAYNDIHIDNGWMLHNTFVWGLVNGYDHAPALVSALEEAAIHKGPASFWGRVEVLQRTPHQLAIGGITDPDKGRWVTVGTLGFTHGLAKFGPTELAMGLSITKDFLPTEFERAYGGDPISGRIFLQYGGMGHFNL